MPENAAALPSAVRGWNAVLATAAVAGVTQVFWLTYSPVATEAAEFYDVSTGAIATLNLVYPILYVLLAIPTGRLLDRAPRGTLLTGAALTAFGGLVRIAGDSYGAGLAGQIIVSIGQPILLNGLIVVARANLPAEQRPAGIAAGSVGFFLGILLGYSMPLALVNGADLHSLLEVQAALGVATGLWMIWAVRHTTAPHLADDVDTDVLRRVLRDPGIRVLSILALGGFGVFGALLAGVQPILKERGFSTDTADLLIDVMILAGLIVAAFLPPLAARRGSQRVVLLGAISVASAALALAAFDTPAVVIGLLFAVVGAALVPALPILLEIAERRMPEVSGTVAAVIWLAGNLGVAVLTGVSSALYTVPAAAFIALAAAGGLTVVYTARQLTGELAAGERVATST